MLFDKLDKIWKEDPTPFFKSFNSELSYKSIREYKIPGLDRVCQGDIVAIIGDFENKTIATFLRLIDKNCIVVPLTKETESQHEFFFEQAGVEFIFKEEKIIRVREKNKAQSPLIDNLRAIGHPGLILFTSGSTGKPKAILHDFLPFIERYSTPRPPLRTLSFLLFDHIGGLNTLLHMLFNKGLICSLESRNIADVLATCKKFSIELLPTTPTFLRMLSLIPNLAKEFPQSIKIISYGTERMDKTTLEKLTKTLPNVDFRQTYGMSELGILRIKSLKRDSLFMKIGGEGVETKIIDNILHIRSKYRMLGYLNHPSPFDEEDWYCTKDIVEISKDSPEYIRIIGRDSEIINVGGLKFMASEVESVALTYSDVSLAKAVGRDNPITGQHVELLIQTEKDTDRDYFDTAKFKIYLRSKLQRHMVPMSIKVNSDINISHRFKRL